MNKIKYELDPQNRLVIKKTGKKTELARFRQVLDGRFKLDEKNNLTYLVKTPLSGDLKKPDQIKLKGKWSLTREHNLVFTLDKWKRQALGDQLTLQGDIIDVNKNSLLFALSTRTNKGDKSKYILRLSGKWQADENNRLTFNIRRSQVKYDTLTFDGAWETGRGYQVVYKYEKIQLKRKLKKIHTLIFKGRWDITEKKKITYVIDRNSNSLFNFRAGFALFQDRYIKYELGIGISRKPEPVRRTVILFGKWKIKKKKGLLFEIEHNKKEIYSVLFGAEAKLTDKNTLCFKLRDSLNQELGAELELSYRLLEGGEAFLRFIKSK
ncbi:MAG: hypothetical protein KJ838_01880, partial [Candidatus Omnitrophica bacterium]|nr:hypothetical protein [Candidatus Omnitrophota bacterium]